MKCNRIQARGHGPHSPSRPPNYLLLAPLAVLGTYLVNVRYVLVCYAEEEESQICRPPYTCEIFLKTALWRYNGYTKNLHILHDA